MIVDMVALPLKDPACSLGGHLEPALLVAGSTSYQLCLVLHQMWPFLEHRDLRPATLSLVTSILDFCHALYGKLLWRQHGSWKYDPVTPISHERHWLLISFRVQLKVLVLTCGRHKTQGLLSHGMLSVELSPT